MSRPFDDRGVVGEVGGVVEFIGTTEQFRVEDLGRLYDSQRIAVDRVRSVGCELPQGIDRLRRPEWPSRGPPHTPRLSKQVGRYQRTYAVVDRDQCDGSGQSGQAVAYRVEPLRPARRAGVLGYVETGCQILPEIDLSFGKDDDDLRAVQRSCKGVYRRPNTGSDPSMRNCLGSGPPRRLPLPPATMITPVPCCSISVSFRIRGYCP